MPRALNTDFYQSFRFAVSTDATVGALIEAQAGFNNVTTPELSAEAVEYRDGQTLYTRKQPGLPTVSDSTLQRGVAAIGAPAATPSPFLAWILAAIEGRAYRGELTYWHIHLGDGFPVADPANPVASRAITLHECFPIRVKADADFDATSAEVSITEMDVACEYITVAASPVGTPASP